MSLQKKLEKLGTLKINEPLSHHTSYRIGGQADYFLAPHSLEALRQALAILKEEEIPCMILGKGSNVLVSDEPYQGVIISLSEGFSHYSFDENDVLMAEAGCSLIHLSALAMEKGLSGLEFAYGIPGSVGGGLFMNAGAYLSDLSSILIDVLVLKDKEAVWIKKEQLEYTYRHSLFQKHRDWIILAGRFQLIPGDREEIFALMENRKQRRQASQPLGAFCAGSVFRNPPGEHAWKIIDRLGFRGTKIGGAKVSEIHSNFIVNEGQASAKDVNLLIEMIQKAAFEKEGIHLITEVERINWNETQKT